MSVSLFIASLHYWHYFNSGYIQFWITYLSHIFLRHSLYVSTIVSMNFCTLAWNYYIVFVCLSVCLLPHLTQIGQVWLLVNFFWFLGSTLRPLVLFYVTALIYNKYIMCLLHTRLFITMGTRELGSQSLIDTYVYIW